MSPLALLSDLIRTDSFASLWFWVVAAGIWVLIGQRVLGVPLGVVEAARRGRDPGRLRDWLALTLPGIAGQGEPLLVWGLGAFVLSAAAVAGFAYGSEAAQVVALLGAPLAVAALLRRGLARRLIAAPMTDEVALARRLLRHRWGVQAIGALGMIVTAFWGMGQLILRKYGL